MRTTISPLETKQTLGYAFWQSRRGTSVQYCWSMAAIEAKSPIDVAQAANAAIQYAQKLFPTAHEFTLEEVELSEDQKFWMITLGYARKKLLPEPELHPLFALQGSVLPKQKYDIAYKVFRVNAETGEVVAMKMRPEE